MFSVRIVTTDHYLAASIPGLDVTHSEFRGTKVKKVPIFRIFGATPAGQKTCMHVHGIFPYLYVPYDGTKPEQSFRRQFASSLDKALNIGNGMAKANIQHVFKISLVSGIPMYGYHHKEEQFLKIYLYNPSSVKKAADLLLGGAVMNKSYQPHESHIPYHLQLFIDFNLYGMNLINVAAVKFRKKTDTDEPPEISMDYPDSISPESIIGQSGINTPTHRHWHNYNIDRLLYLPDNVKRQSTCELEVDVVASDILNRLEVDSNIGTNPGLAGIWEDEKQRRRDLGESSQLTPQESQEHDDVVMSESENELRLRLMEIIQEQQAFPDSQSEDNASDMSQDDGGTQTDNIPAICSSQMVQHDLQRQDSGDMTSSQDTIIVEGEEEVGVEENEPIISLESIQKVLSFSQSFSQPSTSQQDKGDKSVTEILASLAEDSPECSQQDISQIESLEDEDSIMIVKPCLPNHASIKEDEDETAEMSQIVLHEDEENTDVKVKKLQSEPSGGFNLEGMDETWSASRWFSDEDDEEDNIPQFDGASDKRQVGRPKKRLGTRGPVIPQQQQPHDMSTGQYNIHPYHQSQQQYPSQHHYNSNEYTHYNSQWQGGFNTHNTHYSAQGRRFEQPNYETINSPPSYQGTISSSYYPRYNQQQTYPRFSSTESQVYNQPQQLQNNEQRNFVPSSNTSSAFSSGVSDYKYEAITPPSAQHVPEQPQIVPTPQSPLRNILTNPNQPYNPSYLNNRSLSRSSTLSTSSSGSHHSDPNFSKNDDTAHGGNLRFSSSTNLHQSYSKGFNNSSHDIDIGKGLPIPPFSSHQTSTSGNQSLDSVHQTLVSDHPSTSVQQPSSISEYQSTIVGHPSTVSAHHSTIIDHQPAISGHQSVIHHFQDNSSSQPHYSSFSPNKLKDGMISPPIIYTDSFNMTNNSLEDLFSDESSFNSMHNKSTNKPVTDLKQRLSGNHFDSHQTPSTSNASNASNFEHHNLSAMRSTQQKFTPLKSKTPSSQSHFHPSYTQGGNLTSTDTSLPSSSGTSLSSLFNLVSTVSKDNIRGFNSKVNYDGTSQITPHSPMVVPASPPPIITDEPQYTNLDSWKEDHSKTMATVPPPSNSSVWEQQMEQYVTGDQKIPKVGKKQRMKKLGLVTPKVKIKNTAETIKYSAYTFTFQVPTPVFKRLKFRNLENQSGLDMKIVRMHPKEARKYSLLKIGRELVKIPKLTANDITRIQKLLKHQDMEKEIQSIANYIEPPVLTQNLLISSQGVLSKLLQEDNVLPNSTQNVPKLECKKVPNRTEENRALKKKSLKLNKKSNFSASNTPFKFDNMSSFEVDFSHRVIDPDQGEDKVLVLKDVSLLDASDGHLTPIKAQTPVSGRSPAYCSVNQDDIYNKGLEELELHNTHKIFGGVLLCDKEPMSEVESVLSNTHSGSSSRTSSRKESSDSSESLFEDQDMKCASLGKRRHSSANSQASSKIYIDRFRRSSVSYSPVVFSNLRSIEEEDAAMNHKKKRHKKTKEIEGVHYIVVGKFKGHKSMKVKLKRLHVPRKTVSANEFLTHPDKFQKRMLESEAGYELQSDASSYDMSDDEEDTNNVERDIRNPVVPRYESSDSSNSYDSGMMSRSENVSQNVSEASSEGTENSEKLNDLKNKSKRKKLTPNQRLGVAFLTTRARRKKTANNGGKLMSSLSILHQATLANLTETTPAYTDRTDDHKTNYDDVMYKLALFSPPDSDNGETSPPVPSSPTENVCKSVVPEQAEELLKPSSPEQKAENPKVDINEKYLKPLEIDVKCFKSSIRTQSSIERMYETPVSSIETSKADPSFSPSLASVGSSENDFNVGMPELKDETVAIEVDANENDDFWKENRFYKVVQSPPKTAVVKLAPLSLSDISSFNAVARKTVKESSSPPDLGPPNIPAYPRSVVSNYLRDKSPPPPNLTPTQTHRMFEMEATRTETDNSGECGKTKQSEVFKLMAYRPKSILSVDKKPSNPQIIENNSTLVITEAGDSAMKSPKSKTDKEALIVTEHLPESNIVSKSKDNNLLSSVTQQDQIQPAQNKEHLEKTLNSKKIVSYLSSPSTFLASNSEPEIIASHSQTRNLWTDISCGSLEGDNKPQKYKKKHEMYNNRNGQTSISNSHSPNDNTQENTSLRFVSSPPKHIETALIASKSVVLRPSIGAPLRSSIIQSAQSHGLSLANHQEAFCSNPDDMPDRSREVGGRVIKIESNLVKDLNEFPTSSYALKSWRTILTSNREDIIFSSQERESLWDKLEKDPQFKSFLTEDRKQIITPCRQPPAKLDICKWLQNKLRKVSKNGNSKTLEMDEAKKEMKNVKVEDGSTRGLVKEHTESLVPCDIKNPFPSCAGNSSDNSGKDNSVCLDNSACSASDMLGCVSLFECSKIVELSANQVVDFDNCLDVSEEDKSETPDKVVTGCDSKTLRSVKLTRLKRTLSDGEILDTSQEDLEIVSPLCQVKKLCSRWDQVTISPAKTKKLEFGESDSFLHSTPVRRNARDLFEPSCTPISSERNKDIKGDGNPPSMFVTPKRPDPPRRISTNTENTLRRTILTSQMKNQLLTPDTSKANTSQIDGPTPKNSFGFKITQQNLQQSKALHQHQYLTVMSIELHIETRGDLSPNPDVDAIRVIFYSVYNDVPEIDGSRSTTGAIIVDKNSVPQENLNTSKTSSGKSKKRQPSEKSRSVSPKPLKSRSPQTSTIDSDSARSPPRSRSLSPRATRGKTNASKSSATPEASFSKQSQEYSPKVSQSKAIPSKMSKAKLFTDASQQPSTSKASPITSTNKTSSEGKHKQRLLEKSGVDNLVVKYVTDEKELLDQFIQLVGMWDPDILVGFEIQLLSLGYILQRAAHLSMNLCPKLSRLPDSKDGNRFSAEKDKWGSDYNTEIHIAGRIVLNLWRVLKHEVTLNIYDFENIAHHVLHRRIPLYSFRSLTTWFNHRTHLLRWRVIDHYIIRVKGLLQIIDQLDLIGKTSEFARVFGIEFYDVLSRGTQYRVESMMLRLAKPMNYVAVSPGIQQRARMKAPECIALTLEPESKFYTNPVVVLDFQSLYPSIMIAYNYCYSTCLGRLERLSKAHNGQYEFGCTSLKQSPSVIRKLQDNVTISPNGCVFVTEDVKKGVISRMVEEILNTRIMVKKAMKSYKNDKALYRMLDARQLSLKLIANVTYGYTAANFSGRMPCVEIGDSIVRKGRESLERAIKLVEDTPRWGARVVYGDTDSMFLEMKGKSKDEAFVIGQEIADAVTNMYPKPMKLKFEKVYLPCVLQTKKRYVGFMYETPDQKEPVFDAKGIETVRRDNCSAVSKILERCIKILFTSKDISQVKQYVVRQCQKLLEGKVSLQDFVFAKEYRGMSGYKPGACVPALQIARKRIKLDPRSEPRTSERVPYIIVYGSPGLSLIQLVREPRDMLRDPNLRLNGTYYITKQILPPLNRLFSLIGVDVFTWYNEMPKIVRIVPQSVSGVVSKKGTISQYFVTSNCPVCDEQTKQSICKKCMTDPLMVSVILSDRVNQWEKINQRLSQVCYSCMGSQDINQPCVTLDCPILFRRLQASRDVLRGDKLREDMNKMFDF